MAGLTGILNTDLSGLAAYRAALSAISQNISNANTPGYAVRKAALATRYEGVDQAAGTGVKVAGVDRSVSQFADTRLRAAISGQGRADTLLTALTNLQSNFSSSGGINSALNQFFSDAKAVGANPSDIPTRQTLLSDGRQLTAAFNTAAGNVTESLGNLSQQGDALTQQANQILGNLAQINKALRQRGGQNTNALLDQQAAALQNLSKLLGVHVIRHANGTVRIGIQGQVLLGGAGQAPITFKNEPGQVPILELSNGHTIPAQTLGGQLGGVLAAHAQSASQLQQVNRFAAITAGLVNAQQAQGLNLSGNQGQPLLTLPTPSVVPQADNSGSESLAAQLKDPTQLPANAGNYRLAYDGSQWQVTNQANGKTHSLGGGTSLSFDGLTVSVSGGAPAAGDAFTIDPVRGAAAQIQTTTGDPQAIAAAAPYVGEAGTYGATGVLNDSNAGNGQIAAGQATDTPAANAALVPASNFGKALQIRFTSATNYEVQARSGGGLVTVASGSYSPGGGGAVAVNYPGASPALYWQMNIQGQPAQGDTFTLSPGGSQSGTNADALGALDNAPRIQGASLVDSWAQVTAGVGRTVQSAQASQANAKASVQGAQQAQSAVSGVSLDQQAADLQRFTQAYQASAKALATANQLFQSLLNAA